MCKLGRMIPWLRLFSKCLGHLHLKAAQAFMVGPITRCLSDGLKAVWKCVHSIKVAASPTEMKWICPNITELKGALCSLLFNVKSLPLFWSVLSSAQFALLWSLCSTTLCAVFPSLLCALFCSIYSLLLTVLFVFHLLATQDSSTLCQHLLLVL